jgi:hypothetical protein
MSHRDMSPLEQDLAEAGMKPIDDSKGTAKALDKTIRELYVLNERGLPRIRAGRNARYSRREVAAFLEAHREGAEPRAAISRT